MSQDQGHSEVKYLSEFVLRAEVLYTSKLGHRSIIAFYLLHKLRAPVHRRSQYDALLQLRPCFLRSIQLKYSIKSNNKNFWGAPP